MPSAMSAVSGLSLFPANTLYAGLFFNPTGFHWVLFTNNGTRTSTKFHATNRAGGWVYDRAPHNIVDSKTLFAAVKLANLYGKGPDDIHRIVSPIPMSLPAGETTSTLFTCRIWFREAIRRLHQAGIVNIPNVDRLEAELIAVANSAREGVESGLGLAAHAQYSG